VKALTRSPWLYILGALVLIVGAYLMLRPADAGADSWLTAKIERGDIRTTIAATGTLQAVLTVQVGSQVTGRIQSLHADFNSVVKQGQIIARIDPATYEAALVRSRADREDAIAGVATARAALSNQEANRAAAQAARKDAERVHQRNIELARQQIVSERDLEASAAALDEATARLDQAEAQVTSAAAAIEQARARVKQSEAAVRLAEVNLGYTVIKSPVDGVVVSRNVDVGQTVSASLQAPTLFVIANDLTRMQVVANVDEADIGAVGPDSLATFTVDAFPGDTFQGVIDQIRLNPVVTQNVVTYSVIVNVPNPDLKLRPGMTANTTFIVAEADDTLRLPNAALRFWPATVPRERERELIGKARREGGADPGGREEARRAAPSTPAPGDGAEAGAGGPPAPTSPIESTEGVLRFSRTGRTRWHTRVIWLEGDGGTPEPRVVHVGITDGTASQVRDGDLEVGDPVIVGAANFAADSTRPNNPFGSPLGGRRGSKSGGGRR